MVTFDPRGVGVTLPFECPPVEAPVTNTTKRSTTSPSAYDDPDYFTQQYLALTQQGMECAKPEWKNHSELVGTAYVARDIDALFQALGEDGLIRYWGYSYGTLLGSTLAAMFPEKIDRMVLDGNINPTDYYHGTNEESAMEIDDGLENFFKECADIGPDYCTFAETGESGQDLQDNFFTMLETLRDTDRLEVVAAVEDSMFKAVKTPALSSEVDQLLLAVWTNVTDSDLEARAFPDVSKLGLGKKAELTKDEQKDIALTAITCGDWFRQPATLEDWQEWFKAYRAEVKFGSGLDVLLPILLSCSTWQTAARGRYEGTFTNIETLNPILFVNGPYDPVTPMVSALNSSAGFIGSEVLHHEGGGHCSSASPSKCTIDKVRSYWETGKIPDVSEPCIRDQSPFNLTDTSAPARRMRRRQEEEGEGEETKEADFVYPPAILDPYGTSSTPTDSAAPPPGTCTPVAGSSSTHNGKLTQEQVKKGVEDFKSTCEEHAEDSWMYKAICGSLKS